MTATMLAAGDVHMHFAAAVQQLMDRIEGEPNAKELIEAAIQACLDQAVEFATMVLDAESDQFDEQRDGLVGDFEACLSDRFDA